MKRLVKVLLRAANDHDANNEGTDLFRGKHWTLSVGAHWAEFGFGIGCTRYDDRLDVFAQFGPWWLVVFREMPSIWAEEAR